MTITYYRPWTPEDCEIIAKLMKRNPFLLRSLVVDHNDSKIMLEREQWEPIGEDQ